MNSIETGKDKIKKICEILEKETLEPAKQQATDLLEQAQHKAMMILAEAKEKADELVRSAQKEVQRLQEVFEKNLKQGFISVKERLRQEIEKSLLNEAFVPWVKEHVSSADAAAKLITALVQSLEKEGTQGDLSALVSQAFPPAEVSALLGKQILQRLKEKDVIIGNFQGGVQLKLHQQHLTLDLSDQAIVELLVGYIAKEFRDIIFK